MNWIYESIAAPPIEPGKTAAGDPQLIQNNFHARVGDEKDLIHTYEFTTVEIL